jgi:hypothetical protein
MDFAAGSGAVCIVNAPHSRLSRVSERFVPDKFTE